MSAFKSTVVLFCAFFLWLFLMGWSAFCAFFQGECFFLHNVYIQIQCKVLNSKVELPS